MRMIKEPLGLASVLAVAMACSCGGESEPGAAAAGGSAGGGGSGGSAGGGASGAGAGGSDSPCPVGQVNCGDVCVSLSSNTANCGACGNACAASQSCDDGVCTCPSALTSCADGCVDTSSSASHCGNCDNPCGVDETCNAGACECDVGRTSCNDGCVDLFADPANCGACGKACVAGEVCESGACTSGTTDECDTTAECQSMYGAQANDCVNSASDQSWCDCGGTPCADLPGGTGGSGGAGGTGGAAGSGGSTGGTGGATGGTGGSTQLPTGTFLADSDDHIVFEIESLAGSNPPSPWEFKTTGPCQTPSACTPLGLGFYQHEGGGLCGQTSSGSGVMTLNFEVRTAGRYRVVWRNLRDHRDGNCEGDRNNDSFMAFPTTNSDAKFKVPFKVYGGGTGTWNWSATYDINNEKQKVCLEFDAGVHTMAIHGRSRDHAIDKVALFFVQGTLDDCRSAGTSGLDAYPETGVAP